MIWKISTPGNQYNTGSPSLEKCLGHASVENAEVNCRIFARYCRLVIYEQAPNDRISNKVFIGCL